ncbi:MAG: hypothetical protein GY719_21750 [bacterium]|nr:hypothetical protein [bacterium]
MLQLIGYDLEIPPKSQPSRKPDPYQALEHAVINCGTGINFRNGPWIVNSAMSTKRLLKAVLRELGQGYDDRLLVVPAAIGTISGPLLKKKAAKKGSMPGGKKVVAACYALRRATKQDHKNVANAIEEVFDKCCNPLRTFWLISTKRSAKKVRTQIEKRVPLRERDDLLVAEVEPGGAGAYHGLLRSDVKWLRDQRVLKRSK